MFRRLSAHLASLVVAVVLLLLLAPAAASAQVVVKVNDNVNFRFGLQLQGWADWTQDPNSEGYSENMFLRRIRFILAGDRRQGREHLLPDRRTACRKRRHDGNKNICSGAATTAQAPASSPRTHSPNGRSFGDALMLDGGLFLVPDLAQRPDEHAELLDLRHRDLGAAGQRHHEGQRWPRLRRRAQGLPGRRPSGVPHSPPSTATATRRLPRAAPLGPEAGSRNPYRWPDACNYDFFDIGEGLRLRRHQPRAPRRSSRSAPGATAQGDYKAYGDDFTSTGRSPRTPSTSSSTTTTSRAATTFPAPGQAGRHLLGGGVLL